jgi:chromate reductase
MNDHGHLSSSHGVDPRCRGKSQARHNNRGPIRTAIELAPPGTRVTSWDLGDIPLFSADVEAVGDPEPVPAFKQAIARADSHVIATPDVHLCPRRRPA